MKSHSFRYGSPPGNLYTSSAVNIHSGVTSVSPKSSGYHGSPSPFAGFFSKFFIFSAAVQQGFYVLVFIALLNTVISLFYYLIVVKAMFINKNESPIETIKSDFPVKLSLVVCTIAIVLVGLVSTIYSQISILGFGI